MMHTYACGVLLTKVTDPCQADQSNAGGHHNLCREVLELAKCIESCVAVTVLASALRCIDEIHSLTTHSIQKVAL
jgi:hypothetical protein